MTLPPLCKTMRPYPILLLLGLAGCGEPSSATTTFADPTAALDAADAAQAAGNSETALAGYSYAFDHGAAPIQGDALLGKLRLFIATNQENQASGVLDQIQADFADLLDEKTLLQLLQTASEADMADLGDALVAIAGTEFPALKVQLAAFEASFLAIREHAPTPDVDDTGYADN